jgi:hypothetical protein
MSLLVYGRKYYEERELWLYTIIRQDERLRAGPGSGNTRKHGTWGSGKMQIVSAGSPDIGRVTIFLRGHSKDFDNALMSISEYKSGWKKDFEDAVLAFNKAKGNNSDIQMEDVFWDDHVFDVDWDAVDESELEIGGDYDDGVDEDNDDDEEDTSSESSEEDDT